MMYTLAVTRRQVDRQTDQNVKFYLISVLLKFQERQKELKTQLETLPSDGIRNIILYCTTRVEGHGDSSEK
jgi:hypothetical protein